MKTVVIWDSVDGNIRFFVVDKDLSHLNGKYVNSGVSDAEDMEITMLVYDDDTGKQVTDMTSEFPIAAVMAGAKVIVMGFMP